MSGGVRSSTVARPVTPAPRRYRPVCFSLKNLGKTSGRSRARSAWARELGQVARPARDRGRVLEFTPELTQINPLESRASAITGRSR